MVEKGSLSYSHVTSDTPLLGQTIGENIERTVAQFPRHEALVDCLSGRRWTYEEFNADVDALALGLLAEGISKGDRVGIWSPNNPEWTLVQYATAKIGAILVNINPAYGPHELAYALKQSGVCMVISAESFKTSNYRAMIEEMRENLSELHNVVYLDSAEWEALWTKGRTADPSALRERMLQLTFDDPINIQYTSGTTGFPKGATLSHHNILNNAFLIGDICGYTEADRVCIPVPFYHCFGMVVGNLGATSHGACMVIPAPAFDPATTLQTVQDERCTSLYGVPTMFIAELGLPEFASYDLSSLRTGIIAGSPCPTDVMKQIINEMHMTEVTVGYGMTETSPLSAQTHLEDDMERRVSTVGRVHPHLEVKIVDPTTELMAPRGEPGELCVRGYAVMLGYWDEPDKTAEVIDSGRWLHTGDLATMDIDDYVNIVGRIKDMVIRGGENVYPREVEDFLYTHPAVEEAQIVGVPDFKYGEELCAWVRVRDGHTLTEGELRQYCQDELTYFKIPRYVKFVNDFPMTVTGKIQKFKMREESIEELGLENDTNTRRA